MDNHIMYACIILALLLFSITLLQSHLFTNNHRSVLAEQQSAISSSSNQSNRVLGAIASNLFTDNPDATVGGYHPPIYNSSGSKSDAQAKDSFSNNHRSVLAEQQSAISSSSNQSNRVLGAIASNLFTDNPDATVGGYHPPIYNSSGSKSDAQAKDSFSNNHRSVLAEQQSAISSSSNQSNRVLGALASNLFTDNPDATVGGYHPPIYNSSGS